MLECEFALLLRMIYEKMKEKKTGQTMANTRDMSVQLQARRINEAIRLYFKLRAK